MATWKKWTSTVLVNGQPEPNVEVHVYEPGTTNEITVYEDEGITPITQPILTDSQGRYAFFVDVDTYPEIRLYLEKDGVDFSEANEDLDGVPVPGASAAAGTFLALSDTPSSYVGRGGDVVLVKTTEDGIETQPWPVTGTTLNFFLSDDAADIGSYYYMHPTESGDGYSELTSPSLSTGDDQLLWAFVTEAGEPGIDQLALGAYTATLFLEKTGNKDVRVYWKLFKRDTGGTETEILQSAVSDYLTADNSQYLISAYLNEDQTLDPTDRLVLKLYANVSGTGTDVTVTLTMEGDYDSRLMINVLSSAFNLDRLSDVTITSPADNELLAYDSGSGKWINQTLPAHGNEAHDPDYLAIDGSNEMAGPLLGSHTGPFNVLGSFVTDPHPEYDFLVIPSLANDIAYNLEKGGSVFFGPDPDYGLDKNLFDGKITSVAWYSPSGTITVEVALWKTFAVPMIIYCHMYKGGRAKDVLIEGYDPVDAAWDTVASISNWGFGIVAVRADPGNNGYSKIRFSFSNFYSSSLFVIYQIGLITTIGDLFTAYCLRRDGGDMYGDIDMHGNDILNVGEITYASSGLKIGAHVLPILDQDGVPVARFDPDGTIAAKSFVVFSPQVPDDPHEALQVALQEAHKPPLPYGGLCPREFATELQEKIERLESSLEKLNTELKDSQALAEDERTRPTEEIQKKIARLSGKLAELKRRRKIAQEAGTPLAERKTYGKDLGKIVFGLLRYVESLEDRLRTLEKALQGRP